MPGTDLTPQFDQENANEVSTLNSSTANIAISGTFTGTSEEVLECASVSIQFRADMACTVFCDQSADGTNWDITDSYTVAAATGDSRVFVLNAKYLRVRVTNNGVGIATNVRLHTTLSADSNAGPRALTQLGNLKTALQESIPAGSAYIGNVAVRGNTDGTLAGNYLDRLKTYPIPDKTGSGTLAAVSATLIATIEGCGAVSFQITGTWVASLIFEATIDGTNWFSVSAFNIVASTTASSITSNGYFLINCGSWKQVRVKASTYTSGTVNVTWNAGASKQTSTQAEILSPLPGFIARSNKVLAAGITSTDSYTMTQNIAVVDFHFGGKGIGQASLLRINTAAIEFVSGGGFNSSGDVAMWTNAGAGSSLAIPWAYSTAQSVEGTGSAALTFTSSSNNDFTAIKYTWITPKDLSTFRYINWSFYVTLASGGNQTRTASAILTDINGATRTYQITGGTVNAPVFPQNQWVNMTEEIENPDASTGTFDVYNVVSITLKLLDSGNKTGTLYCDNVRFTQSQSLIERIYIDANRTFQLVLNPVELFNTSEVLALQFKNTGVSSAEFTVTAKGVIR